MKLDFTKASDEYERALACVESLMDAQQGSPEEAELERLSILVEGYEEEHFPIEKPVESEDHDNQQCP